MSAVGISEGGGISRVNLGGFCTYWGSSGAVAR